MRTAEYDAYHGTVLVSTGLKDAFRDDEPCAFKASEPKMRTSPHHPARPDAVFQCDEDRKGIVCEIKSSPPVDGKHVIKDIGNKIDKYSGIEGGWMTKSGKAAEHSTLLLVNRVDAKRLRWLGAEPSRKAGDGKWRPEDGLREKRVLYAASDGETDVTLHPTGGESRRDTGRSKMPGPGRRPGRAAFAYSSSYSP